MKEIGEIFRIGNKMVINYDERSSINEWIIGTRNKEENIAFMACLGNDFQTINLVHILNRKNLMKNPRGSHITKDNLIPACIYLSVRKVIKAD